MKKKPIHQLLAVITFASAASTTAIAAPRTLANGAPAPGNTVAKGDSSIYKVDKTERSTQLALNAARRALSAAYTEEREAVAAIVARPRVHANGAPACGNINEKPVMECTDAVADEFVTARIQRVMLAGTLVDQARTHLAAAEKDYAAFARVTPSAPLAGAETVAMEVQP